MMLVLVKEVGVSTSPSIYMNYNFVETNNLVCINAYFSYNKLCVNYIGKLSSDFTSATTVYSNEQWATTRRICLLNDLYFYMYDSGQSHVYSLYDTSTPIESFDISDFELSNINYNVITIGNYLYFINNNSTVCKVYIIDNTELNLTYDSQITIGTNNKFFRYNRQFIYNNTVINKLSILEESEKGALYALERQGQTFQLLNKATATISDILSSKSAYINNGLVSGTMPNNGELNYTPSTEIQTIPEGYTSGGTIAASPLTQEDYDSCMGLSTTILTGCKILKYLITNGTQYINTLCNVTNNTSIIFNYYPLEAGWDKWYLQASDEYFVGTRDKKVTTLWWGYNGNNNIGISLSLTEPLTKVNITSDGKILYNDVVKISGRGTSPSIDSPILIGYNVSMRIGEICIYEGDSLIRDLIPAINTESNVIGMFDSVEKKFFSNSGTGTFDYVE